MELNRRSFLKKALAAGSLAAGTGSLFYACAGIRRSDLPDQNLVGHTANQLDQDVIKVTLKKANPVDYPLQRITRRITVKHDYLSKEINGEDIRALSEHLTGRLFYFPRAGSSGIS